MFTKKEKTLLVNYLNENLADLEHLITIEDDKNLAGLKDEKETLLSMLEKIKKDN
ncbi:MAG: hypothetical protein K9K32_07545 [Halanaerobiales bacterium]|nr:hypothetical protein [Halanaerobiales bacterium]